MTITATEFKNNLRKYLEMVNEEDILITKNGKVIAMLSEPISSKLKALDNLVGAISSIGDTSIESIKEERLKNE